MKWFGNNTRYTIRQVQVEKSSLPVAANDNCFWHWLFGPEQPFRVASHARTQFNALIAGQLDYLAMQDRIDLADFYQTYLDLFKSLVVKQDLNATRALAPRLNRCVPWLMQHCPDARLRPKPNELWYWDADQGEKVYTDSLIRLK